MISTSEDEQQHPPLKKSKKERHGEIKVVQSSVAQPCQTMQEVVSCVSLGQQHQHSQQTPGQAIDVVSMFVCYSNAQKTAHSSNIIYTCGDFNAAKTSDLIQCCV